MSFGLADPRMWDTEIDKWAKPKSMSHPPQVGVKTFLKSIATSLGLTNPRLLIEFGWGEFEHRQSVSSKKVKNVQVGDDPANTFPKNEVKRVAAKINSLSKDPKYEAILFNFCKPKKQRDASITKIFVGGLTYQKSMQTLLDDQNELIPVAKALLGNCQKMNKDNPKGIYSIKISQV